MIFTLIFTLVKPLCRASRNLSPSPRATYSLAITGMGSGMLLAAVCSLGNPVNKTASGFSACNLEYSPPM